MGKFFLNLKHFSKAAVGIATTIVLSLWAIALWLWTMFNIASVWIGRSTLGDDWGQLMDEKLPKFLSWLFSTPWQFPAFLATVVTLLLIWMLLRSERRPSEPKVNEVDQISKSTEEPLELAQPSTDSSDLGEISIQDLATIAQNDDGEYRHAAIARIRFKKDAKELKARLEIARIQEGAAYAKQTLPLDLRNSHVSEGQIEKVAILSSGHEAGVPKPIIGNWHKLDVEDRHDGARQLRDGQKVWLRIVVTDSEGQECSETVVIEKIKDQVAVTPLSLLLLEPSTEPLPMPSSIASLPKAPVLDVKKAVKEVLEDPNSDITIDGGDAGGFMKNSAAKWDTNEW